ncbi:MAG: hypothetical protein AB7K24_14065 [Gemmataceae bacterium]
MRKLLVGMLVLGLYASAYAQDDIEIKDVMKEAMKGGLCKKVATGKADKAEKEKLLKLFQAMAKQKPPKGDAESWKAKTGALVAAAQAAVKDDKDAGKKLQAAANCAACHKVHKP